MSDLTRRAVTTAAVAAFLGLTAAGGLALPAQAGGDNIHYIFGSTKSTCTTNLNRSVKLYRTNDYIVTGIHGCRLAGDNKRYFGDFVANPR